MIDRDNEQYQIIKKYSKSNGIIFKNYKFAAEVYCYINNIKFPRCKVCKNIVRFVSTISGFKKYCSSKCRAKDKHWRVQHSKMWKLKNIDKNKTRQSYRSNNKELFKRYSRKYFKTEKGLLQKRVQNAKRRAMRKKVKENFSANDRLNVFKRFNFKCFNCLSTKQLEIDHHLALSTGTPLTNGNAVLLCKKCNVSKSNIHPSNFYDNNKLKLLFIKYNIGL